MPAPWIQAARKAAEQTIHAPHGSKQAILHDIARENGWSARKLERDLTALAAVEAIALGEPGLAKQLESLPADAVIAAGRWCRYDVEGAKEFILRDPPPSVRDLVQAEKNARVSKGEGARVDFTDELMTRIKLGTDQIGSAGPYLSSLAKLLNFATPDLNAIAWSAPRSDYERFIGAVNIGIDSQSRQLALISAYTHTLEEIYAREAKKNWTRAASCALAYPFVALVFPSVKARDHAASAIPLPPSGVDSWPDWRNQISGSEKSFQGGAIRLAGPRGGIVILTSPYSFFDDWST